MSNVLDYEAHVGGRWVSAATSLEVREPSDWENVIGRVPALGCRHGR